MYIFIYIVIRNYIKSSKAFRHHHTQYIFYKYCTATDCDTRNAIRFYHCFIDSHSTYLYILTYTWAKNLLSTCWLDCDICLLLRFRYHNRMSFTFSWRTLHTIYMYHVHIHNTHCIILNIIKLPLIVQCTIQQQQQELCIWYKNTHIHSIYRIDCALCCVFVSLCVYFRHWEIFLFMPFHTFHIFTRWSYVFIYRGIVSFIFLVFLFYL